MAPSGLRPTVATWWSGPAAIQFGRGGEPYVIGAPTGDAERTVATLRDAVGDEGFHFRVELGQWD